MADHPSQAYESGNVSDNQTAEVDVRHCMECGREWEAPMGSPFFCPGCGFTSTLLGTHPLPETDERPRPNLICQDCHIRPVIDRCSICDECWYAPRNRDRPLMPWDMTDTANQTAHEELRAFLLAASEHSAAMYDLGFAVGARNPQGPAQRNLEETAAAYVKAQRLLMADPNQAANIEREVRESAERFNSALACADAAGLSVRWSMVSGGGENNTLAVKGVERHWRYGRDGDPS